MRSLAYVSLAACSVLLGGCENTNGIVPRWRVSDLHATLARNGDANEIEGEFTLHMTYHGIEDAEGWLFSVDGLVGAPHPKHRFDPAHVEVTGARFPISIEPNTEVDMHVSFDGRAEGLPSTGLQALCSQLRLRVATYDTIADDGTQRFGFGNAEGFSGLLPAGVMSIVLDDVPLELASSVLPSSTEGIATRWFTPLPDEGLFLGRPALTATGDALMLNDKDRTTWMLRSLSPGGVSSREKPIPAARKLTQFVATGGEARWLAGAYAKGSLDLGERVLPAAKSTTYYLARLGADLSTLWARAFPTGNQERTSLRTVAAGAGGDVALSGVLPPAASVDFGSGAIGHPARARTFVASFDATGALRFARSVPADVGAVAVDANGDVLALGPFKGAIDFGEGPIGEPVDKGLWIARFDGSGNVLWVQRLMGTSMSPEVRLEVDANGDIVLSSFGALDRGPSSASATIAKLSPLGVLRWLYHVPDATNVADLAIGKDHRIYGAYPVQGAGVSGALVELDGSGAEVQRKTVVCGGQFTIAARPDLPASGPLIVGNGGGIAIDGSLRRLGSRGRFAAMLPDDP
jgi:hypothetical protein